MTTTTEAVYELGVFRPLTQQVFARYADKEWSFTDCASRVVLEKSGTVTVVL